MPGFSFSPTMLGQNIHLVLKSSKTKISGIVTEVNPAEIVLKHPQNKNLIRVNRDEIEAYSGFDEVERNPDPVRLNVTRCFNMTTRCNGVKRLSVNPLKLEDYQSCPAKNEYCDFTCRDFFKLPLHIVTKLLDGTMVGEYPAETSNKTGKKDK